MFPPPSTPLLDVDQIAKLLLDEERLVLLGMAAQQACSAEELAGALNRRRSNLARHLAQLVDCGLLTVEGEPGQERYSLDVRRVQALKATLFARPGIPATATPDEKVLATFVRNGRLVQYPVNHAKRLVVLRWLAESFEPDREYTEREVNERLSGHAEDYATLRRYLVDHGYLTRNGGIYRRVEPNSSQ
jgi:hypothetical protein